VGNGRRMSESALVVKIVPIRTKKDRRRVRPLVKLLEEILLELRGYSKEEIDDILGNRSFAHDRAGVPGDPGSAAVEAPAPLGAGAAEGVSKMPRLGGGV
jgi:hypothetical protein